jgi:hypothetical protein
MFIYGKIHSIIIIIIIIIIITFSGYAGKRGLWPPRPQGFVITHDASQIYPITNSFFNTLQVATP